VPGESSFPHTAYLIFFTPRSGSYLLCEALATSGLAGFPAEYFSSPQIDRLGNSWEIGRQADYLQTLFRHRTTPNGVFGAKVTWRHFGAFIAMNRDTGDCRELSAAQLASALLPNLRYIWLTRRDKIRQAISYSRALQTGIWAEMGQTVAGGPDPQYDSGSITSLLHGIEEDEMRIRRFFCASDIEPFSVVYEDLVCRYDATCGDILEYLGVEPPKNLRLGKPRLAKQIDSRTEEWVRRYQLEQLRNSQFVT